MIELTDWETDRVLAFFDSVERIAVALEGANHRHEPAPACDPDEPYCDCDKCGRQPAASTDEPQSAAPDDLRPPAGTPVWWDGELWLRSGQHPYRCLTDERLYRFRSDMPGAVPVLTPEQVELGMDMRQELGFIKGREAAARDVDALLARSPLALVEDIRDKAAAVARGERSE